MVNGFYTVIANHLNWGSIPPLSLTIPTDFCLYYVMVLNLTIITYKLNLEAFFNKLA